MNLNKFLLNLSRVFARPFAAAASSADLNGSVSIECASKVARPVRIARPMKSATTTDAKVFYLIFISTR